MKRKKAQTAGEEHGWRSGLEDVIAAELKAQDAVYEYETLKIPFMQPAKNRKYTPDFILLRNGIVIETKGRFVTADRGKHLLVKVQHPDIDIRLLFSNARAKISKTSDTSYAAWCDSKGFLYAHRHVPHAWLTEAPNLKSLAAIAALQAPRKK